jgi:hypothetical protein
MTELFQIAPTTTRDELHNFIDDIDDELAKPSLHVTVDMLPEYLIRVVLNRMRDLLEGTTVLPPELDG